MRKTIVIACAFWFWLLGVILVGPSSAAIVANFTDGNGNTMVDQYVGTAGDGWANAWEASGAAGQTVEVVNTNPLNGGGNYLSSVTDTTVSPTNTTAVRRQLTNFGEVDLGQPYTLSFDFRPDFALGINEGETPTLNDRYHIFGSTSAGTNTSGSNTWIVYVAPGGNTTDTQAEFVANHWGFLGGADGTTVGFGSTTFVDTGIEMTVGTVYHFEISVNPAARTYVGSISDGVDSFTTGTLSFRNQSGAPDPVVGSWIQFASRYTGNADSNRGFSLDNIAVVPEPHGFILASLGILGMGVALGRRRRNLVR